MNDYLKHKSLRSRRRRSSRSSRFGLGRLWPRRWLRDWMHPRRRRRLLRSVIATISWPWWFFLFVFWKVVGGLEAIWFWFADRWRHRQWRYLVQGLPAMLVFGAVAIAAVLAHQERGRLVDRYRNSAWRALQAQDYPAARIYYERLVGLDERSESNRHDLAVTLASLGHTERATSIMENLAPLETTGFGQAHLWLARQILLESAAAPNPSALQQAYAHLTRAKQRLPNAAEVDWAFAQFYATTGRRDAAVPHLEMAAQQMPELYFELAFLLASLGQNEEAFRAAQRARDHLRTRLAANPNDDQARLGLASIMMNLGDFDGALRILSEGAALRPDGPYQRALAAALITRFDQVAAQAEKTDAQQIELLRLALRHDPNSQEALLRLIDLGQGSAADRKQAQELLQTLLVGGYATPFVHFVLGSRAWEAEKPERAVFHLERAYQLDSDLAPVANNLAWILAHADPPDLDRALAIINSVLDHSPRDANYLDTRGQILVKMHRYREALDDLERALPGLSRNVALHEALAVVYRNLGQEQLAEKHEQLAARLMEAEQGD